MRALLALLAHREDDERRISRYSMLCRLGREPERAFEVTMLSRAFLSPSSADGIQREPLF